jgi:hypothetical protein
MQGAIKGVVGDTNKILEILPILSCGFQAPGKPPCLHTSDPGCGPLWLS